MFADNQDYIKGLYDLELKHIGLLTAELAALECLKSQCLPFFGCY